MKSKTIICSVFIVFILQACNKGTLYNNINEKLSNKNRPWALVRYSVNSIDSTDLINYGNFPDFKSDFFQAQLSSSTAGMPFCRNRLYTVNASFTTRINKKTIFKVTNSVRRYSYPSDVCKSEHVSDCQRNVFTPEGKLTEWKVEKFHSGKLVLTCQQKNKYYLELKGNKY